MVVEDNSCLVYYNLNNSKIFCEKELQYLEVESDVSLLIYNKRFVFLIKIINLKVAPAVEFLIRSYPKYVTVEELPLETIDERVIFKIFTLFYSKDVIKILLRLC
jgi:hypothetical protein